MELVFSTQGSDAPGMSSSTRWGGGMERLLHKVHSARPEAEGVGAGVVVVVEASSTGTLSWGQRGTDVNCLGSAPAFGVVVQTGALQPAAGRIASPGRLRMPTVATQPFTAQAFTAVEPEHPLMDAGGEPGGKGGALAAWWRGASTFNGRECRLCMCSGHWDPNRNRGPELELGPRIGILVSSWDWGHGQWAQGSRAQSETGGPYRDCGGISEARGTHPDGGAKSVCRGRIRAVSSGP